MMWEIAPKGGNFRGVCPVWGEFLHVIGRLSVFVHERISLVREGDRPRSRFVFRSRSDTHGCVYEKTHRTNHG